MVSTSRSSRTAVGVLVGALLVAVAAIAFVNRLAFRSNESVRREILRVVSGERGVDQLSASLSRKYRVLASGAGTGPDHSVPPNDPHHYLHVVVGSYRGIPFRTSIEAFVVVGGTGTVEEVHVRRTVEAL